MVNYIRKKKFVKQNSHIWLFMWRFKRHNDVQMLRDTWEYAVFSVF